MRNDPEPSREIAGAGSSSPGDLTLGPVTLNVSSPGEVSRFYEEAVGLEMLEAGADRVLLGSGGKPLVELREDAGAPPRPPGTTGLFHLAVLEPGRAALAARVRRLIEAGVAIDGASDHLVSEAVYLRDPEGNGIEIYRDRPRPEWDWSGGEVAMATLPLDVASLLAEPDPGPAAGPLLLGHVHMNVSDLPAAVGFYTDVLGLDLTTGSYPGAAFVSAGGYHHHFGLNTWNGAGAPAPPAGALGLAGLSVAVPDDGALEAIAGRAREAGAPVEEMPGGLVVSDPDGVSLRLLAG